LAHCELGRARTVLCSLVVSRRPLERPALLDGCNLGPIERNDPI